LNTTYTISNYINEAKSHPRVGVWEEHPDLFLQTNNCMPEGFTAEFG